MPLRWSCRPFGAGRGAARGENPNRAASAATTRRPTMPWRNAGGAMPLAPFRCSSASCSTPGSRCPRAGPA